MYLDLPQGLLQTASLKLSPHHDDRPPSADIDLIVIHGISLPQGMFGNGLIERFFCGELDFSLHESLSHIAHLRVSSHVLIHRDGRVTQFVPFHKRAWHAGESHFKGQERCNDFSIGIELEGTDDLAYEKVQYSQLSCVIRLLMKNYGAISRDRIVGHSDIAPGRKTDPGPIFDWNYLDTQLYRLV